MLIGVSMRESVFVTLDIQELTAVGAASYTTETAALMFVLSLKVNNQCVVLLLCFNL